MRFESGIARHRPAATALIQPLAWKPLYAAGVDLKDKKKKKKIKKKKKKREKKDKKKR